MKASMLVEFGLSENQARVYLEIIQSPGRSGSNISKSLSIDRSFVYDIINSLINKGLVSYVVNGKIKVFYPSDPENLIKEIDEKKIKALNLIEEIKKLQEKNKSENEVKVYEGKAGLKAYVREFLDCDNFYTLGGGGTLNILEVLKYDYPNYIKEFEQKKIKGSLITSEKNKKIMGSIYPKSSVKIRNLEHLDSSVSFSIFNNKLAIYSAEEKPFVLIINNKEISSSLKNYFDHLWKQAKK
ncbi:hypothetical protein J4467_01355 [Candidatus Woesearchaeota archaeon]|nr:hypothetical protein [Candidatus Woesearchaeota archaeon]